MAGSRADGLRFNILGALEGWAGTVRLKLGGTVQERVLVTLLLAEGKTVPVSRLIEAVWDEEPPATAVHQIRKAVADLRRGIPDGSSLILTEGSAYRVEIKDEQVDVRVFSAGLARAREAVAQGEDAVALDAFRIALALWRGPVMSGGGGRVITAAGASLEEYRLTATEQCIRLRLDRGEAAEVIGDLRTLVAAHPLRETLRHHLMLALYRAGRPAEALEEYGKAREDLADELGISPGPQLASLYEAILCEKPGLDPEGPPDHGSSQPPLAPVALEAVCTLPYDLVDFTGRRAELEKILSCAADQRRMQIIAVDGMGGAGKTSLVLRAAHQLIEHYPDGQLFIDLRGHSPDEQPLEPSTVLEHLLRALGMPDDRIPDDLAGRTSLWRTTLLQRRMIIVLDNALDAAQTSSLLPTSSGSLVLITSRVRLVDLDGAEWISLGPMLQEDSTEFLSRTIGEDRSLAEPAASAELAQLCGHLPLALRLVAARLRHRPKWSVQHLTDRLEDEARRLGELSAGERSVEASLRLSYLAMSPKMRGILRTLVRHPGQDIDVYSAAALLGLDCRETEDVLEDMLDMHLVQQHEANQYSFHDLVRIFALNQPDTTANTPAEAAIERLVSYYVAASDAACEVLFPGRARFASSKPTNEAVLPPLKNSDRVLDWFDREHTTLRGAVKLAIEHSLDAHAVHLIRSFAFYLNLRSHFEEFQQVGRVAAEAARRLGDPSLLWVSLSNLGVAHWKLGCFGEGVTAAEEGLANARKAADRTGEGFCLDLLGLLHSALGQLPQAMAYLEQGAALHRRTGYVRQEAEALGNLSSIYSWLGRYTEAVQAAERSLALNRQLNASENEVSALIDLASANLRMGHLDTALLRIDEASALTDETRMPENVALLLALSALARQRRGHDEQSVAEAERALELVRNQGTALRQSAVENLIGQVWFERNEAARSLELHESAYNRASRIGYRIEILRAFYGKANALGALGENSQADEHRRRADEIFAEMSQGNPAHGAPSVTR
ncbi:BTAD domain-containing putative transcriptional regulator [Streptomyces tibetensis]|uniref:AfsR/SARP family transcriptional regulator n=1 Tax=Streptomyces tibetensis TaxID=2382123 RepID=UPI0033E51528